MSESQQSLFTEIQRRLARFGRRYYLNGLLQNTAVFITSSISILLIISIIEYFSKNESTVRAVLFYSFLVCFLAGFVYLVLLPALKSFGLMRGLSDTELSRLVGKKMIEVDDKLLNILQLNQMQKTGENTMIDAAINQKSGDLIKIPFHLSATLKNGWLFIRYSAIFITVLGLLGLTFPEFFNYGTRRLVYYDSDISPPPPFTMIVTSDLTAVKNEVLYLDIKVVGQVLPGSITVVTDKWSRRTKKISQNEFQLVLKNITEDFYFNLDAGEVVSDQYVVKVLRRPYVSGISIETSYPVYLKRKPELFRNTGNLTVPEGSKLEWSIQTEDAGHLKTYFKGKDELVSIADNRVSFDRIIKSTETYSLTAINSNGLSSEMLSYKIDVIKDQFPEMELEVDSDTLNSKTVFSGTIIDDYGFSAFRFAYKLTEDDEFHFEGLQYNKSGTSSSFYYQMDWNRWNLSQGEEVVYFFEVIDNDGVNGPKSTKSGTMTFKLPDDEEIEKRKEELSDKIEEDMKEAIIEAKKLREEVEKLEKELTEENNVNWMAKKKIQDLLKRNEDLKQKVDQIGHKNEEKNLMENNLIQTDEIVQKRKELERLMNEVLDDEMIEKLKELESLMEKISKEELKEKMEEIQISNEQLEKELERSLELYKQLEFEKQLNEVIDDLDILIEQQSDVKEKTEGEDANKESLVNEQNKIREDFEALEKDLDELMDKNEELENKHELEDHKQERELIKQEMNEAAGDIEKGKNKKAGEKQKDAAGKMDEMKDDLDALKMSMQAQSMEDIQSLRNTLENLIELSFEQERIMQDMKGIRPDDPQFNELTRQQRGVLDGLKVVEDSLVELGSRISQIEPTVNRELNASKISMERSLKAMTERKIDEISRNQQISMMAINNLALLLDEIVNQLQQQMMESSGQCSKPGSSKPSKSSMKQMQQQLNRQIEEMKNNSENGKKPGGKPGEHGSDAESLAKMAAQQAKIREELRKMAEESDQKEAGDLKKIGELMEETEKDLVNRQINRETLMRQEKILTRLLEAENAERQQDMDERRQAEKGEDKLNRNLFDLQEYYKAKNYNNEELMKQNISLSRYYQERLEQYFKIIVQ